PLLPRAGERGWLMKAVFPEIREAGITPKTKGGFMRKNAFVIASIVLAGAGCATSDNGYRTADWEGPVITDSEMVAAQDLNSSDQLEENMTGQYELPNSGASATTQSGTGASDAVGSGPDGMDLFRNNRAHGVGSAATGEMG